MEKIKKVNNLICSGRIFISPDQSRRVCYTINQYEADQTNIFVSLPRYSRPERSDIIVQEAEEFVNGYKVVQTANGEYAYVRENDNILLPYRYDIAYNFNEFGFAIVGKEGSVSWIDKDFKFLNLKGEMVEESSLYSWYWNAWQKVSSFSKGSIPLSLVYDGRHHYGKSAYFGIDGKMKEFYHYGCNKDAYATSFFQDGTIFDERGYAQADQYVLLASGYLVSYEDLFKICAENGFLDFISEEADKKFGEKIKMLKKEL